MLAHARAAIHAVFTGSSPAKHGADLPCFSLRRGVFVTIHVAGKLRGCIGVTESSETLRESIAHCARSAAFQDSRFPSLVAAEMPELQIEISVLSDLLPIARDAVEIGKHGLLVQRGERRGLLLPQVAVEHHLSTLQFLEETCRKAGLARDVWRDPDTQLFAFTCHIFHENPPRGSQL